MAGNGSCLPLVVHTFLLIKNARELLFIKETKFLSDFPNASRGLLAPLQGDALVQLSNGHEPHAHGNLPEQSIRWWNGRGFPESTH